MASTTKIMTCILALELGKKDQVVTFSDTAAAQPDVQMNGKAGQTLDRTFVPFVRR